MSIANSLKTRRGPYAQFDPGKLVEAEPAAVLSGDPSVPSGKAFYVCFKPGDVRRLVSIEDLEQMVARGDFDGEKGDTGTGIKDVKVNTASHLIITLTDNTTIDAGYILDVLEAIDKAEASRVSAESARKTAESARASAESLRKTAETGRASAELQRADEESKRAESARNQVKSVNDAITSIGDSKERANEAAAQATAAAGNANAVTKTVEQKLANGDFVGPQGPAGINGVTTPVNSFFTLGVESDGNLYAYYAGDGAAPQFEMDANGDVYFVTPD